MSNLVSFEFSVVADLRVWPERRDVWTYFSMPDDKTLQLDEIFERNRGGFRSIPVRARLARQSWRSALFRYRDGTWALPVKKDIRRIASLEVGDTAQVDVTVLYGSDL
jgi:hypothetical protein